MAVALVALGCVPEEPETLPTTTTTSIDGSTSSVPGGSSTTLPGGSTTTIPDGATIATGVCEPLTVPAGDARSAGIVFGGGGDGYDDAAGFEVLDVSLGWDAAANEDIGIVLSSSDDSYAGLVVGPAGAGGSVTLRDGAAVSILDAVTEPGSDRLSGEFAPVEGYDLLDAPTPDAVWTLELANLSETDDASLTECTVRILVR